MTFLFLEEVKGSYGRELIERTLKAFVKVPPLEVLYQVEANMAKMQPQDIAFRLATIFSLL